MIVKVILILLTVYAAAGCLCAALMRNFSQEYGDDFDALDFLLIVAIWPYYVWGGWKGDNRD